MYTMEFVYVLTSPHISFYKIGRTKEPQTLTGRYGTSFGGTQEIRLFATRDGRVTERMLHKFYHHLCIGGECFARDPTVDYIGDVSKLIDTRPLTVPEAVAIRAPQRPTRAPNRHKDLVANFVEDMCTVGTRHHVKVSDLAAAWERYERDVGAEPM